MKHTLTQKCHGVYLVLYVESWIELTTENLAIAELSIKIKEKLESFGKNVQLIALREITSERLDALTDIEAFIQTGCPRISVDGYTFSKPVLSVPQTDALINLLSGKEITTDIFVRKHWL